MKHIQLFAAVIALAAIGSPLHAQSEGAYAAWGALKTTPIGAFAPAIPMETISKFSVRARYGRWKYPVSIIDINTSTYGLALTLPTGKAKVTIDIGASSTKDCDDCGTLLGGADVYVPLRSTSLGSASEPPTLTVAVNPALGFAKPNEGDGSALSLSVNAPVSVSVPVGERAKLVPFVTPGFGYGRVSGEGESEGADGESEGGTRFMFGLGLAIEGLAPGLQITAGFHKIFIKSGGSTLGLGVSFGR